jgi:8-oxo-dGTP diphosphatase
MLDAVIAVITNGDKVLFIQRAPNIRGGGHWAPVSGEVEAGESQEAAVAREAMEEVGLTVRPIRKVWENVSTRGTFKLHWWMAQYVSGELTPNLAEVSDARWLTVDEICRMDGTFEGDREFYRNILPALAAANE